MKVDVEKLSNVEIKVAVEVPAEVVDRELDKQYREIAKSIAIRGFRKGKAPRSLLEQRFGKEVAADTARVLIAGGFEEALKDVDAGGVGEPVLENDPVEGGKPFRYTIRVETRPTFEPQGYKDLDLPPVDDSVSDDEVDERLKRFQEAQAALVPAEEGEKADIGHVVVIDFRGTKDGEPFPGGSAEDVSLELGSGRMIPGFEDELIGAGVGDERSFDVTFPEDYPAAHLAGVAAHFDVTVKELQRKDLPALDDDFAKDQGADDLAALTQRIRADIAREKRSQAEELRSAAVADQLIERNPLDVPPRLLEQRTQQRMHDLVHRLEHAGHDHDKAHEIVESQADAFRKSAERELREHFILRRIADAENIGVTDADVDGYIEELAAATKLPLQRLRTRFQDEDARASLENELRERKVREAVVAWSTGDPSAPAPEPASPEPASPEPVESAPVESAPVSSEPAGTAAPESDDAAKATETE